MSSDNLCVQAQIGSGPGKPSNSIVRGKTAAQWFECVSNPLQQKHSKGPRAWVPLNQQHP